MVVRKRHYGELGRWALEKVEAALQVWKIWTCCFLCSAVAPAMTTTLALAVLGQKETRWGDRQGPETAVWAAHSCDVVLAVMPAVEEMMAAAYLGLLVFHGRLRTSFESWNAHLYAHLVMGRCRQCMFFHDCSRVQDRMVFADAGGGHARGMEKMWDSKGATRLGKEEGLRL